MVQYIHREEVRKLINQWVEKIKELNKLVAQLEKLLIKIISLVGWILILIELIKHS